MDGLFDLAYGKSPLRLLDLLPSEFYRQGIARFQKSQETVTLEVYSHRKTKKQNGPETQTFCLFPRHRSKAK